MRTFWRITKLLGDYKRLTVAGFALAFAQMGLSLLVPRVTQLAIDRALLGGDSHMLVWYGLGLIGVGAVRFAVGVGRRLTTGKASLGIEYDLRQRLWSHLLRQPFAYFDRWPTGQLMSRLMSDITNVRMFLGYGMVFFAVNVVMILAIAVILLALDWRLALLSLAFLPALLLVTWRFSRRLRPILRDVQQRIADVTAAAEENVVGSRIVRIFAREDDEMAKFSDRSTRVFEASVAAARTRAVYVPLIAFLPNLAVAFLLWYGGRQVVQGSLTLGELVAFYTYLMMLVYPAQVIGWLTGLAQRAMASGERIYELLDAPIEMEERPDAAPLPQAAGAVTFDRVSFAYGDRRVLEDVSLEVPAGRTVALVGHTGCGKTTLANLVPRFYDATEGEVLVDGVNVRDYSLDALRNKLGYVPQSAVLFSGTIASNVGYGDSGKPAPTLDEIRRAVAIAQGTEFVEKMPEKYDAPIARGGTNVSGGQKQRLCIARALLKRPKVLIFDDSTSAVDTATEARIRRRLAEELPGVTKIVITQRVSAIEGADRIVVLENGRIRAAGTHAELLERDPVYRDICRLQRRGAAS